MDRIKLNTDPINSLSIDGMKSKILKAVKSEESLAEHNKAILSCVDPTKKNWTPFKVKKALVDQVHDIINASPKEHSASNKMMALKLINQTIIMQNQEINKYIEQSLIQSLSDLAQFCPAQERAGDAANFSSTRALLSRGRTIFGPDEQDGQMSAKFLVILLDYFEKWSSLSTMFSNIYKELLDLGIQFPSSLQRLRTPAKLAKKSVTFSVVDSIIKPCMNSTDQKQLAKQIEIVQLTDEKRKLIIDIKGKMLKVKEAAKKCKKFQKKDKEDLKIKEIQKALDKFESNKKLAQECAKQLKNKNMEIHIANSQSLQSKMLKYSELFQETIQLIQDSLGNQKQHYASAVDGVPVGNIVSQVEGNLAEPKASSLDKKEERKHNSYLVDPQDLNFDEDQEQMDFNDAPRVSEQMYLDLDPTQNSNDQSSIHFDEYQVRPTIISKFDFDERESSQIGIKNFDFSNFESEDCDLRNPRTTYQQITDDINLTEEYEQEISFLQNQLQNMPTRENLQKIQMYDQLKDQNNEIQEKVKELIMENETLKVRLENMKEEGDFEESDMKTMLDNCICELNLKVQQQQVNFKNEYQTSQIKQQCLIDMNLGLTEQVENGEQIMKQLTSEMQRTIDEKIDQINRQDEYIEQYRKVIQDLEGQVVNLQLKYEQEEYSIDAEIKSPEKKSYRDTEICFKSPLNFQQLGSSASGQDEDSVDKDKSILDSSRMISPQLQQKNFIEADFDNGDTLRASRQPSLVPYHKFSHKSSNDHSSGNQGSVKTAFSESHQQSKNSYNSNVANQVLDQEVAFQPESPFPLRKRQEEAFPPTIYVEKVAKNPQSNSSDSSNRDLQSPSHLLKTPTCPQDSGYGGSGQPRRSRRLDSETPERNTDLTYIIPAEDDTDEDIPADGEINPQFAAKSAAGSVKAKDFMNKLNITKRCIGSHLKSEIQKQKSQIPPSSLSGKAMLKKY